MPDDQPTPAELRRQIDAERDGLANAVEGLRDSMDPTDKLRANLPAVAGGALAAGFILAGGIGATVRLLFRRGREGNTVYRVGRYRIVDDD